MPIRRRAPSGSSRKRSHLKNFFVPHHGNKFRPLMFSAGTGVAIAVLVLLFQGAYLIDTHLLEKHTNFMASVLPGVLASLTDADREANGVADLTVDPLLNQAAQMKADDMATNGYFAHVSPTGKTPWYWLDQVGYQYTYAGENLAVDFTDSKDVESAWMASPTHHANIVKPQYSRIGFGVSQGMYNGHETTFVVEEFAAPRVAVIAPEVSAPSAPVASVAAQSSSQATPAATSASLPAPTAKPDTLKSVAPATDVSAPAAPTQTAEQVVALAEQNAGSNSSGGEVLGTETASSPVSTAVPGFFASMAASPTHAITYALGALAAILAILLGVTLGAHARVQYVEVVGTGLAMVSLVLVMLMFNQITGSKVTVPGGGQSASVVQAFAGQ